MLLRHEENKYYLTRVEDEDVPLIKKRGFAWDGKYWSTTNETNARQFFNIAIAQTRRALETAGQKVVDVQVENSWADSCDVDIPAPEGMEYRPYQRAGIWYGICRNRLLIADEPGLGKSIVSAGIINCLKDSQCVLVICPASLKINWSRELDKWLLNRSLTIGVADSSAPWPDTNVVILNYNILKKFTKEIHAIKWDVLILDEVHQIRNTTTQAAKEVYGCGKKEDKFAEDDGGFPLLDEKGNKIIKKKGQKSIPPIMAHQIVALTGTPILNKTIELQPILAYLCRGLVLYDDTAEPLKQILMRIKSIFSNKYEFGKRYCDLKIKHFGGRRVMQMDGASNLEELQRNLRSTLMIRRLKKDVLGELPPKVFEVLELPADSLSKVVQEENASFKKAQEKVKIAKANLEIAKVMDDNSYSRALSAYKQETTTAFSEFSQVRKKNAVLKVPTVIAHLEEELEKRDKLIVFAHHTEVIELLKKGLKKYNPVVLQGKHSSIERQKAVDAFQTNPKVRVFIGSIQAAGVGLTLTAASLVVFAELDWVPANMIQAQDRAHRFGQLDTVIIRYIVLEGSNDYNMSKILISKGNIANAALDLPNLELGIPSDDIADGAPNEGFVSFISPDVSGAISADIKIINMFSQYLTAQEIEQIQFGISGLLERNLIKGGMNDVDAKMLRLLEGKYLSQRQAGLAALICKRYLTFLDLGTETLIRSLLS